MARRMGFVCLVAGLLAVGGCCQTPDCNDVTWWLHVEPLGSPVVVSPGAQVLFRARAISSTYHVLTVPITWHADPQIGTIDAGGLFSATPDAGSDNPKSGDVTCSDGTKTVSVRVLVTVTSDAVTRLEVTSVDLPLGSPITVGTQVHFTAVGVDELGNRGADARLIVPVTWTVEGGVGNITPTGLFTAWIAGRGTVVATLDSEGEGESASEIRGSVAVEVVGASGECEILDEPNFDPASSSALPEVASNDLIVGLSDDQAGPAALRAAGAEVVHTFRRIPAAIVRFRGEVSALGALPAVRYVCPDTAVYVEGGPSATARQDGVALGSDEQRLSWNVDLVDAERVWGAEEGAASIAPGRPTGRGIVVAIVDTGVAKDHEDLTVLAGTNFVSSMRDYDDDFGHGTSVAGIVAARDNSVGGIGIAPECDILAVKVLDRLGTGTVANVMRGIEWAADNGANIINLSLGISFRHAALQELCDAVWDGGNGALLVAASGNAPQDRYPAWPGNFGSVISTGATDAHDAWQDFSMAGFPVEMCAPGLAVPTTAMDGGYTLVDGTSFSTGHVTGAAALAWSTGHFGSAGRIRQQLRDAALDLGVPGRDLLHGYGRVNAYLAVTDLTCADQ